MSVDYRLPRHSQLLDLLRFSLVAGIACDLALAALSLLAPGGLAGWLGLSDLGSGFSPGVVTVLVVALSCCGGLAVYDPVSYQGNIVVTGLYRLVAAGALVLVVLHPEGPAIAWTIAGVELALALTHLGCWWPLRR